MSERYYAESAFDSTRGRVLPPVDNNKFGIGTRKLRERPINTPGSHCREYFSLDDVSTIQSLNEIRSEGKWRQKEWPGHEYLAWGSLKNPAVVVGLITWVAGFITFFGGGAVIIGGFLVEFNDSWALPAVFFLFFPSIVYIAGKILLRSNLVKSKNNTLLNRRTGIITIQRPKGNLEIPFDEFDPYLTTITNPTGSTNYCLHLGHRYSSQFVQFPGSFSDIWAVYLNWEYWQQYMDISKPLPDAPRMEPYRSRDPVTSEYDAKHNRPKDYWKNLDPDTAYQMIRASIKAVSNFPWGSTRQGAIASGWRPSGYGEGPSTRMPAGMAKMPLKKAEEPPPPYDQAVIENRGDFAEH